MTVYLMSAYILAQNLTRSVNNYDFYNKLTILLSQKP